MAHRDDDGGEDVRVQGANRPDPGMLMSSLHEKRLVRGSCRSGSCKLPDRSLWAFAGAAHLSKTCRKSQVAGWTAKGS